jgi:ABC-type sugar transport system ATPase subunit
MTVPALQAKGIHRSFGAVTALRGADLVVWPGEMLGLVPGNRAGNQRSSSAWAAGCTPT